MKDFSVYQEWKKNWLEHNKKQNNMKKHNFNEAIDIFKGMFEGWRLVTKDGEKHTVTSVNPVNGLIFARSYAYQLSDISHLEQTIPMNGDKVRATDESMSFFIKALYIGKAPDGKHVCQDTKGVAIYSQVELISPKRKLSIDEATELLKSVINEPFEIE